MEKGQTIRISGISLFLISLTLIIFDQAYATTSEDPFPPTLPPQPNFGVNLGSTCTDNENNPPPDGGDGLCNSNPIWEYPSGLRITHGGVTYKYLCAPYGGPDPVCPSTTAKDIYVEYDWFYGHAPDTQALTDVRLAFANKNINLHLQQGGDYTFHRMNVLVNPMVGSQTPPNPSSEFNDIKRYFFGTPADRLNANYLTAKRQAFHYAMFGHFIQDDNTLSGMAEMPGNDMFITMSSFGPSPTREQTAGTFMHELGHNLGLNHGGPSSIPTAEPTIDCKPNYVSVMSSSRMTPDLIGVGWELSYSSVENELIEGSLSESASLGLEGKTLIHGNDNGDTMVTAEVDTTGIDWNADQSITPPPPLLSMDANFIQDIDCNPNSPGETYNSSNDWNNLDLKFRVGSGSSASWGDGVQVGKYKDIFQKIQDKSKEPELTIPEKFSIYRDKEFYDIKGTVSITKSPRSQLDAGIPPGQVICEQSHEFIYANRTKDSIGTPLCIKTIHFGKFLERFKELIFFDNYICDINSSIGEYGAAASTIDNYTNSKTEQPLNCSEYLKQFQ